MVSTMPTMYTEENPGPQEQSKTNQYSPWLPTAASSNEYPGATARKLPQELICPSG